MHAVPADLYLKKVYRCPCWTYLINKIFDADLRECSKILQAVSNFKILPTLVFSTRVVNRTSCFLICAVHMECGMILLAETKCLCTSEAEDDFFFISLNRRCCKHCIKHYMRKICKIFPFAVFHV